MNNSIFNANVMLLNDRYPKRSRLGTSSLGYATPPPVGTDRVQVFLVDTSFVSKNQVANSDEDLNQKVSNMLTDFKNKYTAFCEKEAMVHSFWLKVDQSKKSIKIFTFTDDFDFDLEKRIFDGPYGDLPASYEGFYIDLMVEPLSLQDSYNKSDVEIVYSRDTSNA